MTAPGSPATPPDVAEPTVSAMLRAALADGVTVGARRFVQPTRMTFQHRQYLVDALDTSQLLPLIAEIPDDPERLAGAMLTRAYRSGQLFVLLGGLLVVEGESWTPALGAAYAAVFANADDEATIDRLSELLLWLVLDFFTARVGSGRIFLKSLVARTGPVVASETPGKPNDAAVDSSGSAAAEIPITATTPSSSAPSPFTGASS